VFGLVGHVGSGTSTVAATLCELLKSPALGGGSYDTVILSAREEIESWANQTSRPLPKSDRLQLETDVAYQDLGDDMRQSTQDNSVVASALIKKVRSTRAKAMGLTADVGGAVVPDGKRRAYIRPDFDWSSYLRNGRIEAVLCQCGARDWAVPFAQFFIPNTGPAGRHGFIDPAVINVRDGQYGHSTAFTAGEPARNLARGGRWDRFLQEPLATFSDPSRFEPSAWSPVSALIRHFTRVSAILLLSATALVLVLLLVRLLWGRIA